jgi:Kef-type K+ transport system membrane component KefB
MLIGHPVFFVLLVAVLAPLLAEVPVGFRVPVVVIEVVLGIVIGPYVLGLVAFDGFVASMFHAAMATTLFMAGLELDFSEIGGRPLALGFGGWVASVLIGVTIIGVLHVIPRVHAPLVVTLTLCTTGLGILLPIFRDSGQLKTEFGRLVLAAGTLGEIGPIIAMSLLLSTQYTTWQEVGLLFAFLAIVGAAIAVSMGARPPKVLLLLNRHMHASTQLPVRMSMLLLAAALLLAERFGFESVLGAFAAGMVVGQATRGEDGRTLREKIEAVTFGWFYPFFFVGTGIKFNLPALGRDATTPLLVLAFALLFLVVRGAPVFLYRGAIARAQRLPFVLAMAVPSLSIIVIITEIGLRTKTISHDVAAALIGAALLSVLLFPTIAGVILQRLTTPQPRSPG